MPEITHKKPLARLAEKIERIGDELKVRVHLAGLDAKEALGRVQDRLMELRGKLGASADSIVHDLSQRLGELSHTLRRSEGADDATEPRARG